MLPVVEALAAEVGAPISVDTTKAEVARRALAAGAAIINDITAMERRPRDGPGRRRGRRGGRADAHAGRPQDHAGRPALRGRRPRGLRLPGAAGGVGRVARHPARADRRRPGHRVRQDDGAQPRDLAEPRAICHAGMCGPGRHVAQGVPGHDHRTRAGRPRDGLGGLGAGGLRGRRAGREGPRRRGDRGCDQGLGGGSGLGGGARGEADEIKDFSSSPLAPRPSPLAPPAKGER